MRTRQALAAVITASALALTAGCGSDSPSDSPSDSADPVIVDDMGIGVTGKAGEKPTLTIPDRDPASELQVQVLTEGSGPKVGASDVVVANYLGQTWKPRSATGATGAPTSPGSATQSATKPSNPSTTPPDATASVTPAADAKPYVFDNSYDRGEPAGFSLAQVIPGWKNGIAGQKVGSRLLLSIPPDQGYGPSEGHDLQKDTLIFVVDIVDAIDSSATAAGKPVTDLPKGLPTVKSTDKAPTIDFTNAAAPKTSDSTVVIAGDGTELGNNIVVNMVQASYPDGGDVISTWDKGQAPLVLAPQQVAGIPGLSQALKGKTVGSRVVTRISAADNAAADGSKGTPIVLSIDVIGTF